MGVDFSCDVIVALGLFLSFCVRCSITWGVITPEGYFSGVLLLPLVLSCFGYYCCPEWFIDWVDLLPRVSLLLWLQCHFRRCFGYCVALGTAFPLVRLCLGCCVALGFILLWVFVFLWMLCYLECYCCFECYSFLVCCVVSEAVLLWMILLPCGLQLPRRLCYFGWYCCLDGYRCFVCNITLNVIVALHVVLHRRSRCIDCFSLQ